MSLAKPDLEASTVQRVPGPSGLYRWFAIAAGVIVTGVGIAGLVAWAAPGAPLPGKSDPIGPLRPESAAGLAAAGPALLLLIGSPGAVRRHAGHAFAAIAAAIGLLGVLAGLGADANSLSPIRSPLGAAALDAPPLTPASATALLLSGLSLILIDVSPRRWLAWSHVCALGASAIALVTVLAYIFETGYATPGLATMVSMPPPTAAAVLILANGTFLARPGHGLMRPLTSAGPGGVLARRLVPTVALVPFGIVASAALVIRLRHGPPALALALSTALFLVIVVLVVSGTLAIIDDAAARRDRLLDELAAERDFTGTLLHSLCEAVVVFDRNLQVIDANPRAVEVLGLPRDELLGQRPPYSWQPDGQPVPPLPATAQPATPASGTAAARPHHAAPTVHGTAGPIADDAAPVADDAAPVADGAAALAARGTAAPAADGAPDQAVRRPDGTLVPVLARMSAVLDNQRRPRAYVGTFVDIRDLKRAEGALADHAAELQRANDQLRRGNEQLSEAAAFKRDLMSLVSHEVSQPLSSVASLAELLASDWTELPDETRLDLTQKIDKNARRLTSMINDMVLLFRLDAGTVNARRESVAVGEVVDAVADGAPDTAQVVTSVDPDLYALVDRGHLTQVLSNLVANAMAHGEPPIEISAELSGDGVIVSVRDYGEGIAEDHLPRLFDRVSPRRSGGGRRSTGTGLGLFIVRHLVEVNAGTIWYEPADPRGARLSIRLEPATTPALAGRHRTATAPATTPTPATAPVNADLTARANADRANAGRETADRETADRETADRPVTPATTRSTTGGLMEGSPP